MNRRRAIWKALLVVGWCLALMMWCVQRDANAQAQRVVATWYGKPYHGRTTSCGERFDRFGYTLACNWLPCGTKVRLTYQNHVVLARVTDRLDANHPANQGRRIDVSEGIAEEMGWKLRGRVALDLEVLHE